ncbi:MAG: Uma2 family endonuclease [Rubricoccaceae bacterium]
MTPRAYFAWEVDQLEKHEYYDGEVFAMAGGTERHAAITANTTFSLIQSLRPRGCRVFSSGLRVQLTESRRYVYPDVSAVCEEPRFLDDDGLTLLNPTLVVEVLSESTMDFDRGTKAMWYRAIPSLQMLLVVSQDQPAATVYTRTDGRWLTEDHTGLDAQLDVLGTSLELADLYLDVTFEEEASE